MVNLTRVVKITTYDCSGESCYRLSSIDVNPKNVETIEEDVSMTNLHSKTPISKEIDKYARFTKIALTSGKEITVIGENGKILSKIKLG
jgi:hypothetical protein